MKIWICLFLVCAPLLLGQTAKKTTQYVKTKSVQASTGCALVDRTQCSLNAMLTSVRSLNTVETMRVYQQGGHDLLLPDWLAENQTRLSFYNTGCLYGDRLVTGWLIRRGHPRWAKAVTIIDMGVVIPFTARNMKVDFQSTK